MKYQTRINTQPWPGQSPMIPEYLCLWCHCWIDTTGERSPSFTAIGHLKWLRPSLRWVIGHSVAQTIIEVSDWTPQMAQTIFEMSDRTQCGSDHYWGEWLDTTNGSDHHWDEWLDTAWLRSLLRWVIGHKVAQTNKMSGKLRHLTIVKVAQITNWKNITKVAQTIPNN